MACDLLRGIDVDALSPVGDVPPYSLHFPDGLDSAARVRLATQPGSLLAGRLRRTPPFRSNRHWSATPLRAAVDRIMAADDLSGELGFAAAATEDFRHVWQAKLEGGIKPDGRFVVALPTPYTLLSGLGLAAPDFALLERMDRLLAAEVRRLFDALPPEEISVQWDVCAETRIWESRGRDLGAPRELPERLLKSFVSLSESVPVEAEMGWHFCHRGAADEPFSVAHDAAQVTRLAGAIIASTDREPGFVDIPVPRDRDDVDYFAPLANLGLWPAMDVFLCLVHAGDDVDSAWRRLYAASGVLPRLSIAPACGADPAAVLPVLEQLLARVAADVPAAE